MEQENFSTSWQFYTTSTAAWSAMLEAIEAAKKTIELEQYILWNDAIGSRFIELLIKKAAEGVKVRILCDTVGSFPIYRSSLQSELLKKNIELRFFNTVIPWSPHKEALWAFRNHKKLLVLDGKIGFTGGICIAEGMKDWRESTLRIEGPVLSQMIYSFEVMWNKLYHKAKFYIDSRKEQKENNARFKYLTNSPLPRKRFMYHELIRAIRNAKHYINLTTPYFLPDYKLVRTLKAAVKRGVKIKLLVPMRPNHFIVNIGAATFFDDILSAGVRIFRYKTMIHSKTMLVDGIWSSIGSLNLDNLSLRYNFEANIVSTDKDFSFEIEKQFIEDLKFSEELLLPVWRSRSFFQKFLEVLVWPIRKLL